MKASHLLLLAVAAVGMGGCQTLTEELPTQAPTVGLPPIPVLPPVVVPVEIPQPQPPSGGAPTPPSNPLPPPAGNPPPTGGNPGGQIPNNTSPVTKLGAKVYFLECNGQQVPGSEFATEAQVGCRIHFDCTPKDANNNPTQSQGIPSWSFNPGSLVQVGNTNEFTPTATAKNAGDLTVWASVDGVTSNSISIRIYN